MLATLCPADREGFETCKNEKRSAYDRLVGEGKIHRSYYYAEEIKIAPECESVVGPVRTRYINALTAWSDAINYNAYLATQ